MIGIPKAFSRMNSRTSALASASADALAELRRGLPNGEKIKIDMALACLYDAIREAFPAEIPQGRDLSYRNSMVGIHVDSAVDWVVMASGSSAARMPEEFVKTAQLLIYVKRSVSEQLSQEI